MAKFSIPVPPAEIQREIVNAGFFYEKLEAELEAELRGGLEARRRQVPVLPRFTAQFR